MVIIACIFVLRKLMVHTSGSGMAHDKNRWVASHAGLLKCLYGHFTFQLPPVFHPSLPGDVTLPLTFNISLKINNHRKKITKRQIYFNRSTFNRPKSIIFHWEKKLGYREKMSCIITVFLIKFRYNCSVIRSEFCFKTDRQYMRQA